MWLEALLAPEARSPRSSTATESPLRAARRATPRPVMPPPTTTRSSGFTAGRDSGPTALGPGPARMAAGPGPCSGASAPRHPDALVGHGGRLRLGLGRRRRGEGVAVDPVEGPLRDRSLQLRL